MNCVAVYNQCKEAKYLSVICGKLFLCRCFFFLMKRKGISLSESTLEFSISIHSLI